MYKYHGYQRNKVKALPHSNTQSIFYIVLQANKIYYIRKLDLKHHSEARITVFSRIPNICHSLSILFVFSRQLIFIYRGNIFFN